MRRFKSSVHLQCFASVHGVVQNLFRVGRHLLRAAHHRLLRTTGLRRMGGGDMCLLEMMTGVRHPATAMRSARQLDSAR